jgi:DNA-directed RNA polymerase subunit RPC12/RpoP
MKGMIRSVQAAGGWPTMTIRVFKLKVVAAPATGCAIQAPPPITVSVSANTNHYLCGSCGTLLVIADNGQVHGLVVQCRECGHYSAVDT